MAQPPASPSPAAPAPAPSPSPLAQNENRLDAVSPSKANGGQNRLLDVKPTDAKSAGPSRLADVAPSKEHMESTDPATKGNKAMGKSEQEQDNLKKSEAEKDSLIKTLQEDVEILTKAVKHVLETPVRKAVTSISFIPRADAAPAPAAEEKKAPQNLSDVRARLNEVTQALLKALEAGNYNAAPSTLVQGSALQIEDLSPVMNNVTYDDSHIKLQKMLKVDPVKSTLAQFDRQLSYGIFGATAQNEGAVGQEEMSEYVRIVVPMAYYSHVRRVTVVANLVATVDGVKAEERAASDGAKKIAGDIEFDSFRGKADFSNAGLFDGSMLAIPGLPNILSAYNKISFGKERIILAGAPQDATSADLRRQWVSGGTVNVEASRFLSGRTRPATARSSSPGAPSIALTDNAAQGTSAPAGTYNYYASAVNERGESVKSTSVTVTIAAGDSVTVTITPPG